MDINNVDLFAGIALAIIILSLLVSTAVRMVRSAKGVTTTPGEDQTLKEGSTVFYRRNRKALRKGASLFGTAVVAGFRWRWRQGRLRLLAILVREDGSRLYRAANEVFVL